MTALLLLLLAQPAGVFENPEPFKLLENKAGLTLQGRPIKGTKYSEYRVITDTPYPARALCEHIYEWGTKGTDHPGVKLHKVLKDGRDERVVYDQLEQPVVSDRDYALTVVRRREPDGTCRIHFWTSNDLAPPKPAGFVRMERLWGSWQFEPLPGGKARLTYTLFADPAGSIPSFLVHGPQKSAAKQSVITGLKKVKARSSRSRRGIHPAGKSSVLQEPTMRIRHWIMAISFGVTASTTSAHANPEPPAVDAATSPADPWKRHALQVSVGIGSPVGFAGIVYDTPALGPFRLQAGVGWGASGMLLSSMPKVAIYMGQTCRIGFGAGLALGISALAVDREPGPVSSWMDVDLINVECRSASRRAFSFGFGFTARLSEDIASDDEDGIAELGNGGPQLHFGFGNTF